MRRRLDLAFYRRDAVEVGRDLLGRVLCRRLPGGRILRGRLVEVEAYVGPEDRASHAHGGLTRRNAPMFEAGGIAYVYLVYGMHHCLNVVTGDRGHPAAVLLRAAEPPEPDVSASGPGRLTRAFAVDRSLDGASLLGPALWLEAGERVPARQILRTPRVGVSYAGAWSRRLLRFVWKDHPLLSVPPSSGGRRR